MRSQLLSLVFTCMIGLTLLIFLPSILDVVLDTNSSQSSSSTSSSDSSSTKIGLTPLEKEKASHDSAFESDQSVSEKESETSPSAEVTDAKKMIKAIINTIRPVLIGVIVLTVMITGIRFVITGVFGGSGDYSSSVSSSSRREPAGSGRIVSEDGQSRPAASVADALETMINRPAAPAAAADNPPTPQKRSVVESAKLEVKKEKVGGRVIREAKDNVQEEQEPARQKQSRRVIR